MHFRQPFQLACSFTPAHQGSELLHVGKGFANGGEPTAEAGSFDCGFCRPLVAASVVVALEFELFNEHLHSHTETGLVPPLHSKVPATVMAYCGSLSGDS
jgi:hypothetical protein